MFKIKTLFFFIFIITCSFLLKACDSSQIDSHVDKENINNIEDTIESLINISSIMYDKISKHRELLFTNAIEQMTSIVFSTHRIMRIKCVGRISDSDFHNVISIILKKQNFFTLTGDILSIPRSKSYGNYSLKYYYNYHDMSFKSYEVECKLLSPHEKRIQSPNHYTRPIPTNKEAKNIELLNFSKEILSSINILNSFNDNLSSIEIQTAKVQSIESTLRKLLKDSNNNLIDNSKEKKQVKYNRDLLNTEAKLIDSRIKNLTTQYTHRKESINEILSIICD